MTLKALKKLATSLGGEVRVMASAAIDALDDLPGWYPCPFADGLGVLFPSRAVLTVPSSHPGDVIHELGHALSATPPERFEHDEYAFFGWEWVVATHLGLDMEAWWSSHAEYNVSWGTRQSWTGDTHRNYTQIGALTRQERALMLAGRVSVASRRGFIRKEAGCWIPLPLHQELQHGST